MQYKLELYAQGFTDTATLDSIDVYRKMHLLEKLASLWRSDFRAKTVSEAVDGPYSGRLQSAKWWMWNCSLFIRHCNSVTNVERSWPWLTQSFSPQQLLLMRLSIVVDPLQDLVGSVFATYQLTVTDVRQEYQVFVVEFRLALSQLPHPDSACSSLNCTHAFDEPGGYIVHVRRTEICGDRVVVVYQVDSESSDAQDLFIQVIDWRKGHAKHYPLCFPFEPDRAIFRLLDEQTMIGVGEDGQLALYTLRELDGSPQHRVTYLLPNLAFHRHLPSYMIHATPSFYCTTTRPDLLPRYVPSLKSRIVVLEVLSHSWPVILVIDTVIFSEQAIHSEVPLEIPWSDWGPQYTQCFPHYLYRCNQISVFGSKMAYALPRDCTPEPGESLAGFWIDHVHFYVHIWDFNKRLIARVENTYDRGSSPSLSLIRTPGRIARSCFVEDITSNQPYIATVCRTPFTARRFERLFLQQDRFILSWDGPDLPGIQVIYPVVGADRGD
ncbi:hypothetical protein K503DRAFT_856435 [Rhizopogon vinicolor AM-OR11-026]|uniref:F-box domain-containing protein n=1 Tax=Rhizopogon vinicolor AM-OR11-026 TaxID=1314800 RepID=A0A1B7N1T9_9AGAM|nr:hypothetical protein K503DRAFT_856435 [Rhizopogon vinicolor AM-OR11-026]